MIGKSAFIVFSVAVGLGLASPVQAQDKWDSEPWIEGAPVTMKLGYNTVRQYPHARAMERFVNRVAERTGENFQIQTFPSEQAGNERAMSFRRLYRSSAYSTCLTSSAISTT